MSEGKPIPMQNMKKDRKEKLFDIIKEIDLDDRQKLILKERWADQTAWYGSKAREAKKRRNYLRIILIVSGSLLPAVPSLDTYLKIEPPALSVSMIVTSILGIIVAATAGLDSFFDFQDSYNRYRETAELLKMEGWSYMSLSGTYKYYSSHQSAFEKFCERVEDIMKREIKAFVEAAERRREKEEKETVD